MSVPFVSRMKNTCYPHFLPLNVCTYMYNNDDPIDSQTSFRISSRIFFLAITFTRRKFVIHKPQFRARHPSYEKHIFKLSCLCLLYFKMAPFLQMNSIITNMSTYSVQYFVEFSKKNPFEKIIH